MKPKRGQVTQLGLTHCILESISYPAQHLESPAQSPALSQQRLTCSYKEIRIFESSITCRLYGRGEKVSAESSRVQEAGGWIDDGRVCDILAVSRAFGDREFKGEGLPVMLRKGVK